MGAVRFRQLPHTADVRLAVYGQNEEELMRHLALGIGRLVLGRTPQGPPKSFHRFPLPQDDLAARLVRVGNEVVFWLFAKGHVTVDVRLEGQDAELHLRPLGPRSTPHFEIKAVTFHALRPQARGKAGLAAVLTLDL